MSVSVRLSLIGRKGQPIYKIVVCETRSKRDGKYVESLGTYDPNVKPPKLSLDKKKLDEWVKKGAIVSQGLAKLLKE